MKSFFSFFGEKKPVYEYRVKIAKDFASEEEKNLIKDTLSFLDIVEISDFSISPIMESPLDFPNIKNTAVCTITIKTHYPASLGMLERACAEAMSVPRGRVKVIPNNSNANSELAKLYGESLCNAMMEEYRELRTPPKEYYNNLSVKTSNTTNFEGKAKKLETGTSDSVLTNANNFDVLKDLIKRK